MTLNLTPAVTATPVVDRFTWYLHNWTWLQQNDGQPYHVTKNDRGGATAWGITQLTWSAWVAKNEGMGLPNSVAYATQADIVPLIRAQYWLAVNGPLLPHGIDLMCYDFGYLSGTHRACTALQAILGVDQDGMIGHVTAGEAAAWDKADLIKRYAAAWLAYDKSITGPGGFGQFGKGWTNRINGATRLASQLAGLIADPALPQFAN